MEWLANLSVKSVLVTAGLLLVLRLALLHARGSPVRAACEFIEASLAALVFVFLLVRPFVLQAYFIPSPSMHPTLREADRILVDKLVYRFGATGRGDVVVFHPPEGQSSDDKDYIKRIIGLPDEVIEVVPELLLVDGRTLIRITRESASEIRNESFQPKAEFGFTYPLGDGSARIENGIGVLVGALGETLKVAAYGNGDAIRADSHFVFLNDQPLLTAVFGPVRISHDLSQWGGARGLTGTVYSVNDTPRLILVRGKKL